MNSKLSVFGEAFVKSKSLITHQPNESYGMCFLKCDDFIALAETGSSKVIAG